MRSEKVRRGEVKNLVSIASISTKRWKKCGNREHEGGGGCGSGQDN